MGCGKPSRIVPTTERAVTDKPQAAAPRPASIAQHSDGNTTANYRSSIPVKATKPRSTAPTDNGSPDRASNSNSLKENQTPPQSPPKPQSKPPSRSSTPKRTNSRSASRVSNGHARGGGVPSPAGSVSGREIKVQKRPRSRASGDLLNGSSNVNGSIGSAAGRSKNFLKERDMNGGHGTGDISNNSSLSARSSKNMLTVPKKGPKTTTPSTTTSSIGKTGTGGKNSNSSLMTKPPSLELVVVIDPEVEGKTRIPRPRQVSQLVDPRRYIRVARSHEDIRDDADVSGSISDSQYKVRKASTMVVEPQGNAKTTRPQMRQRPRSMMLLDSPEAKSVGLGSWAGAGEAVKV